MKNLNKFLWVGLFSIFTLIGCGGGSNDDSPDESGTTEEQNPPTAPDQLLVTDSNSSSIILSWNDKSDNETGFMLERSADGSVFEVIATIAPDTTSYSDSDISIPYDYSYRIKAINDNGSSDYSNIVSAEYGIPVPNPVSDVATEVLSATAVRITWTDNSDNETGFIVEKTDSGLTSKYLVTANITSYTDSVSPLSTISYRVASFNSGGQSAYSTPVSATTPDRVPSRPAYLSAISISSTAIGLNWVDTANNETSYTVEKMVDGDFETIATLPADCENYTDNGLTPETSYSYRVKASNDSGDSPYSDLLTISTSAAATTPDAPSYLNAYAISSSAATLNWMDNSDNENGFVIERAPDNSGMAGDFSVIANVGADTSFYNDSGLLPETTYYYRVYATNDAGDSTYSNESLTTTYQASQDGALIIGHNETDISKIPPEAINLAKEKLVIAYNHTSHGSQIITGMNALKSFPEFGDKFLWTSSINIDQTSLNLHDRGIDVSGESSVPDLSQGDAEVGQTDETTWAVLTRNYLNQPENAHVNVIMWSWCNIEGHDIELYLNSMENLIAEFGEGGTSSRATSNPVTFIFMTAHNYGPSRNENISERNEKIRAHVRQYGRILFDFADIEEYDPDGNYYFDLGIDDDLSYYINNQRYNWATEWLDENVGSELYQLTNGEGVDNYNGTERCAHSGEPGTDESMNCILKGRAAWWLYARIAGWQGL